MVCRLGVGSGPPGDYDTAQVSLLPLNFMVTRKKTCAQSRLCPSVKHALTWVLLLMRSWHGAVRGGLRCWQWWHQPCLSQLVWGGHGVMWGHFYPTSIPQGCQPGCKLLMPCLITMVQLPGLLQSFPVAAFPAGPPPVLFGCHFTLLFPCKLLVSFIFFFLSGLCGRSIWLCGELGIAGVLETWSPHLWLQWRDQSSLPLKLRAAWWQTEGTSEQGKKWARA